MVLLGGRKPYAVIWRSVALVAQYDDDLFFNIDGKAAKHRAGHRRQVGERIQHEFMGNHLPLFDGLPPIRYSKQTGGLSSARKQLHYFLARKTL